MQRYLEYAELTDVLWLADDGVAGDVAFEKRPDGSRLLALLAEGRVRTVVVLKIDRLGRSALEILRVVEAIRKAGVRLVSIKESIDLATPTGTFFMQVLSAFAELERAWITERTVAGRRAKVESGQLLPTYKPLYGYRWRDRAKGQLEPDPLTSPVVERIYRETVAGRTLGEIGADLERDGIPGPGGGVWHRTSVRNVLRHPYYGGTAAAWRWVGVRGTRTSKLRPPEEWLTLPAGTVPALVTPAVWETAQGRLRLNGAHARRNNRNPEGSLLRGGYARCALCGISLAALTKPTRQPYYNCHRHIGIGVAVLDAWVWTRIRAVILDPEHVGAGVRGRDEAKPTDDAARLDRRIAEAERRQRNLWGQVAERGANPVLLGQIDDLERRRLALVAERATTADAAQASRARARERLDFLAWCRATAAVIDAMPYTQKRDALEALRARVRVWPLGHEQRAELLLRTPMGDEDLRYRL